MDVSSPPFSYSSLSSDSEVYNISSPESLSEGRPKSRKARCKNPSKQRRNASEKEKLRMRDLTKALHNLRTFLPPFVAPAGQTLTKIETLRLAIRYISYLSSQLDLQMSYCQHTQLRSPHHSSMSHSWEAGNLGNNTESFNFQHNKPPHGAFDESWMLHDAEEHITPPHSDVACAQGLYERHITLQSESRFIQAGTEQRDGIKLEIHDCGELFSADFHSLMNPQMSLPQQAYGRAEQRESTTGHDFWV
ncbi:mesoderm posterior bb [Tachysurus vachellii]|uniref:mesoderm posterior bb n=1 Tax=Tachysurus vachellii TaxID=175792 RepID=UPI00296B0D40|nr:mesoderm posterior bb [Tachysurus vachellii]